MYIFLAIGGECDYYVKHISYKHVHTKSNEFGHLEGFSLMLSQRN